MVSMKLLEIEEHLKTWDAVQFYVDFDTECRSKKLFGFCELKRNADFEGPILS